MSGLTARSPIFTPVVKHFARVNAMGETINSQRVYALRKAGILDVPFIYALMLEGSKNGVFNDFYTTNRGQVEIFKILFKDLIAYPGLCGGKYSNREFYIFTMDGLETGFISFQNIRSPDGQNERNIAECAICEEVRNQKHGWHLINMVIDTASEGTRLSAYCTPYAHAMQAVLFKHHFQLEDTVEIPGILPLRHYTFTKASKKDLHARCA